MTWRWVLVIAVVGYTVAGLTSGDNDLAFYLSSMPAFTATFALGARFGGIPLHYDPPQPPQEPVAGKP